MGRWTMEQWNSRERHSVSIDLNCWLTAFRTRIYTDMERIDPCKSASYLIRNIRGYVANAFSARLRTNA